MVWVVQWEIDYLPWLALKVKERGRQPRDRGSLKELTKAGQGG